MLVGRLKLLLGLHQLSITQLHHSNIHQISRQLRTNLRRKSCVLSNIGQYTKSGIHTSCIQCSESNSSPNSQTITRKINTQEPGGSSKLDSDTNGTRNQTQKLLDEAVLNQEQEPEFPSDPRHPDHESWRHSQSKHAFRPRIDPRETSILLFPGQGSQFVGMGRELLEYEGVEDLYTLASDILGYDLLDLCLNGPQEQLNQTVYCQPAVMVTSLAAVEKLIHTNPAAVEHCISAAGFSIGEYSALVFSGAISFQDAVKMVKIRAEAMQAASESVPSGMMTVFLSHKSKLNFACYAARRYCSEELGIDGAVCQIANYLFPECKVIAGHAEALDFIEKNYREFGLLRTKRVSVSGAFHTSLMSSAKEPLLNAIKNIDLATPAVPVHSNVNSYKYKNANVMEKLLCEQVYKPVKWEQTMHVLYSRPEGRNYPFTFELGPGKQLGSILKKVNNKAFQQYAAVDV